MREELRSIAWMLFAAAAMNRTPGNTQLIANGADAMLAEMEKRFSVDEEESSVNEPA